MRLVTDVFEFGAPRAAAVEHDLDLAATTCARRGPPAAQELAFTLADGDRLRRGGRRPRAGRRRLRAPAVVLLRRLVRAVRGGRQVPGGPPDVGPDHAASGSAHRTPRSMMCRFHVQTAGSVADRPVDRQQRRPDDRPGARRGPRRRPEPAHELARRGARAADRGRGPARPPDPADPRPRGRRRPRRPTRSAARTSSRSLTDELEAAAQAYLDEIDAMGGTLAAIEAGFQQRQIQESAYRVQREIERGDQIVVGRQPVPRRRRRDAAPPIQRIDPEGERRQVEGLRRVRAERDPAAWAARAAPPRGRGPRRRTTCCRRSSRRSRPTPRSARSRTASGRRGASTAS